MANKDKYTDRVPIICAAGAEETQDNENVASRLKSYHPEFYATILLQKSNKQLRRAKRYKDQPIRVVREGEIVELRKTDSSRTSDFTNKIIESIVYKRIPLGKAKSAGSKPETVTNDNTTFGVSTKLSEKLYDIILPPKTNDVVRAESQQGHANYILSHGDYNPSEQIKRNYDDASFNPDDIFGMQTDADPSGLRVKRVMKTCYHPCNVIFMNCTQDEQNNYTKYPLGKTRLCSRSKPNNLPPNTKFGKPIKIDKYDAKKLIYGKEFNTDLKEFSHALIHIHDVRRSLKRRGPTCNYIFDIKADLENCKDDYCTWETFFGIFKKYNVHLIEKKIKVLADHLKLINSENKVKFRNFLNVFDATQPFPYIENLFVFPYITDPEELTTYRRMISDPIHDDPKCYIEPAGVQISEYPKLPKEYCTADAGSLSYETTMKALINPSVLTHYGLDHRDYLLPRNEDTIRGIFMKPCFGLSEEDFEKYWEEAKSLLTSKEDLVSVEAFSTVMKKYL